MQEDVLADMTVNAGFERLIMSVSSKKNVVTGCDVDEMKEFSRESLRRRRR